MFLILLRFKFLLVNGLKMNRERDLVHLRLSLVKNRTVKPSPEGNADQLRIS